MIDLDKLFNLLRRLFYSKFTGKIILHFHEGKIKPKQEIDLEL